MFTLLGVDVGRTHLALALVELDSADFTPQRCAQYELLDIAHLPHARVPRHACKLFHGTTADMIQHVIQEHADLFAAANEVVIERQPPCGMTDIEQLLLMCVRDKAVLLSPQTMHKFIGSSGYTYDNRKRCAETAATKFCPELASDARFARKHDIADAICLTLTRAMQLATAQQQKQRVVTALDLDRFRYTKAAP